jgi:hypothetical protein
MMKILTCVVAVLLLSACHSKDNADSTQAKPNGNWMNCIADGLKFSVTGEQVDIGSFGASDTKLSLGLGMNLETDGNLHSVSSGLMAVPLQEGTYTIPGLDKEGYSGADYSSRSGKAGAIKRYTGANYWLNYATAKIDPATKLQIKVTTVEKKMTDLPNMMRLHIAGNFNANVAYSPDKDSDECIKESVTRPLKGGSQYPVHNAGLCGAEKTKISCDFDITANFNQAGK